MLLAATLPPLARPPARPIAARRRVFASTNPETRWWTCWPTTMLIGRTSTHPRKDGVCTLAMLTPLPPHRAARIRRAPQMLVDDADDASATSSGSSLAGEGVLSSRPRSGAGDLFGDSDSRSAGRSTGEGVSSSKPRSGAGDLLGDSNSRSAGRSTGEGVPSSKPRSGAGDLLGDSNSRSAGRSTGEGVSSSKPRSGTGDLVGDGNSRSAGRSTSASTDASPNLATDDASKSSYESDEEPEVMYADLSRFAGSIRYKHDASKDFWFADYSNLSAKEMRELLKARGQGSSGAKAVLARRLVFGNERRLNEIKTLGRLDKLASHERHISALLSRRSEDDKGRRRSRSTEPLGQSVLQGRSISQPAWSRDKLPRSLEPSIRRQGVEQEVTVEDASMSDVAMDDCSADGTPIDLFSVSSVPPPQQLKDQHKHHGLPPKAMKNTPQTSAFDSIKKPPAKQTPKSGPSSATSDVSTSPTIISTKSTASTAQSTVSSLNTLSSLTGRLLNARPRRDSTVDGVANFVSVMCPPAQGKADPSDACHATMIKVFGMLQSADPAVVFYPIWDAEPGCEPIPPLTCAKDFPKDLAGLQVYARISNPWDLSKVKSGEVDKKTGELRRQKALFVSVLLGTRYTLEHVLEIAYPSLSSIGSMVRKKDVDALESVSLFAFVGLPNARDSISLTASLQVDLEKHEEWMNRNVKSGYNAMQFAGTEFPPVMVRRNQIRLPDGTDVLSDSENDVIQYAYSLRKLNAIEVSAGDKFCVNNVILDFKLRGNLKKYSADCDLLA
eukprot:scaffold101125_cov66-Cyclotella_meneghiniana.AAC.2